MGRFARARARHRTAVYPLIALFGVLGGCSSPTAAAQNGGAVVRITEKDFHISGVTTRVAAGDVVLSVDNQGPDDHELIVVRTDDAALPLRADGVTVDEEQLDGVTVGALEPGPP